MLVDGKQMRPIWLDRDTHVVKVIDQRRLPHELIVEDLHTVDDVIRAIKDMYVRGAPLIGVTGAFGVYVATRNAPQDPQKDDYLINECDRLKAARPTYRMMNGSGKPREVKK